MDISTDVEKVKNFKDMSRCRHVTQQNILFHLIKTDIHKILSRWRSVRQEEGEGRQLDC